MAGKGVVVKWERVRTRNYWLDAFYNSCAAGSSRGVKLVSAEVKPKV